MMLMMSGSCVRPTVVMLTEVIVLPLAQVQRKAAFCVQGLKTEAPKPPRLIQSTGGRKTTQLPDNPS